MEKALLKLHAEVCKTLSNPKRLEILNLLRGGEKSVSDLSRSMGVSQANMSQHLALLRSRGMINARREAVNIYYSIANPKIIEACDLLREVLLEQLAVNAEMAKRYAEEG